MSTGPASDPSLTLDDSGLDEELGWKEEGLFVRDLEGRLIRYDQPTHDEFERLVEVTIDGHKIKVKKAVPLTDEMGNPREDKDGQAIPRATTVYDAVTLLYEELRRGQANTPAAPAEPAATGLPTAEAESFKRAPGDSINPIPILCHMKYMDPVAVCRICVVQISRFRRRIGKNEVDEKLLPACQHRVEEGMIIDTIASTDTKASTRIETAVKTLLAMLMADHPTPCAKEIQTPGDCELESLAKRFNVQQSPFAARTSQLDKDTSSVVIAVDHNACILCDRCIRGCDVIKKNHVLGRMGKGYTSRIAFDLGTTMGSSTCVACGECMVSCPTGALTFTEAIEANWYEEELAGRPLSSQRRRQSWFDWLTFGVFQRSSSPRPVKRARQGASAPDAGATSP